MFSQVCVKNSVHGRGVHPLWADTPLGRHHLGRHPQTDTPPRQTPLWPDTPLDRHPLGRHPLTERPPPTPGRPLQRTVRILLKCFLATGKFHINKFTIFDFSAKLLIHVFHAIFADVQFVAFTKYATDLSKPQVSLPDPDGIKDGSSAA